MVALLLAVGLAAGTPASAQQPDVYSASEAGKRLVVRITGDAVEGSGVIYHVDERYAYGFTARHVLLDRTKRPRAGLQARFSMWSASLPLEYTRFDPQRDFGSFRIDLQPLGIAAGEVARTLPFEILGDVGAVDRGDGMYTVGHASGGAWIVPNEPVPFAGTTNSTPSGDIDAFKIEHRCLGGHSGGGVFDEHWRLVGMMIHDKPPYCEALKIDWILQRLHSWKETIQLRPAAADPLSTAQTKRNIVVAVSDFDNRSDASLPRIGLMAHEVLSRFFYDVPGVTLVTRDRIESVLVEQGDVGSVVNASNQPQLSQIGRLLKADALVLGSVIQYDVKRRTFSGGSAFGKANAAIDVYRMEISLQLLDVETGRVRFSRTFDTTQRNEYAQASSAPRIPVARQSELLRELVEAAGPDLRRALEEVSKGLSHAGQLVQVPVVTRPEGASVMIDGVFVGSTPMSLDLLVGLQDISISLAGHAEWRHRVKVEPGTTIDIALVPSARGGSR